MLTNRLRAAVFARDKGICSFSGRSVWILDEVIAAWQHDWPDHVLPVSRGGSDGLDNLVCATYFYNRKKSNNGADNAPFFREGHPTEIFFQLHAEIDGSLAARLVRHSAIVESDWYFNRALASILVLLDQKWRAPSVEYVRGVDYWQKSAAHRLADWRRMERDAGPEWFLRRGIVRHPESPDVRLMLSLAEERSSFEAAVVKVRRALRPYYTANAQSLYEFSIAKSAARRDAAIRHAELRRCATQPLLDLLRRNAKLLTNIEKGGRN
jgi:hypothetical protein